MEETKRLTTTAMMIALSVAIGLILYFLPWIQGLVFLIAIPLVVVGVKYKYKYQGLALLAVFLIILIVDPIYALTTLFLIGPLSFLLTYGISNKKNNSETIFLSGLAVFFSLVALLLLVQNVLDIKIIDETMAMVDVTIDEIKEMYIGSDVLNEEEKIQAIELFETQRSTMKILMPSFMFIYAMMNGLLAFLFTKFIFKRIGIPINIGKFKDFRISREKRGVLLVVIIVITLGAMIDKENGETYILNFTSLLMMLLQINAMALIWFKTDKHPQKKLLRSGSILLLLLSSFLGSIGVIYKYALSILGFLDMHVDFRKKGKHLV